MPVDLSKIKGAKAKKTTGGKAKTKDKGAAKKVSKKKLTDKQAQRIQRKYGSQDKKGKVKEKGGGK